ncbi:MAG: carboxypeptidase regulatory-like domain-containing protein, partial [Planctomycetaceae bacterium]
MRLNIPKAVLLIAAACVAASPVQGQTPVTVQGVAYDSLRGAPMKNALVAVLGVNATTTTDERGRFAIDRVPPGTRTFIIQHASLDSIGFRGLSRRFEIGRSEDEVRLALPSFGTLWRITCGSDPPRDSGFIYGTIRHVATRSPVARARVAVSWIVTTYHKARGIRQRRVFGEAVTDANGNYAVCGVPAAHWIKVAADMSGGGASAGVDVPPPELRIVRRDLLIGPAIEDDSASRGSILGMIVDQDGVPYSEARVVLDDSTEVRSRGDGTFDFRDVRAGTRQLEIMSIGIAPIVSTVDVLPGDSSSVRFTLRRVTTLDVVEVTASRRGRKIAEGL